MGAGVSLRPENLAEVQDWMKARTGQRWLLVPTDVAQ